jgi:hypothetical protein
MSENSEKRFKLRDPALERYQKESIKVLFIRLTSSDI